MFPLVWDGFNVGNLADLVYVRVHECARLRFFLLVPLVLDSWRGNFNLLLPSSVQETKHN